MFALRLTVRLRAALVAAAVAVVLVLPASAAAHSFLIRSTPEAGSRLASSPRELTLFFSEAFIASSERISLRRVGGGAVELAPPTSARAVVHQPLPPLRGVYIVSWRVLSDDGHISLGELAFAVGSSAALPTVSASSSTPLSGVLASWFFFAGLALALGGLFSERFLWKQSPSDEGSVRRAPVLLGLAVAAIGAAAELVLVAGERRGGGFSSGFSATAIGDALSSRPARLTVAVLAALTVAAALMISRWLRLAAVLPLGAASVFQAERGHSGTSGHGWAVAADSVHLLTVALWLGALAHLVLIVVRAPAPCATLVVGTRRYARFALPTVVVISATGILTAIPEFRGLGAVISSGYGKTLLVKAALIGVAVMIALLARSRALPANPHLRLPLLKRLTLGEGATLVAVLAVVAILVNVAPPRGAARANASALGPAPVGGPAVRLADLAGQLVLGLAASQDELQFLVVPPSGQPTGKLKLVSEARLPGGKSVDLYPRPCGDGCFSLRFRPKPGLTTIDAELSSSAWRGGRVRFALSWPLAREQPRLPGRVAQAMSKVPALTLHETVTSGPGSRPQTTAYRLSGRAFVKTELFSAGAVDVRRIGRRGPLSEIAFALPASNIWYRMSFDRRYRLRGELILSPGHRISRTFSYGGAKPARTATGAPRPPAAPLELAREADDLAVGLAVEPQRSRLTLAATVIGGDGRGLSGLKARFQLNADRVSQAAARSCGDGCYRAVLPLSGKPRALFLELDEIGKERKLVEFAFPRLWPPRSAGALARRATRVFQRLKSLVFHERLASSATNAINTTWRIEAPNRLSYKIVSGPEAIVIGSRRWDREGKVPWQESTISPLSQPSPAWGSAPRQAALISRGRRHGRAVSIISFLKPEIPAWFTLTVDERSGRTLELRMVAPAHFMHHRYFDFNERLKIRPPEVRNRAGAR